MKLRKQHPDFPGGRVDKNPPGNAGVTGWSGENPHAAQQLKPMGRNYWAHVLEPTSHNS